MPSHGLLHFGYFLMLAALIVRDPLWLRSLLALAQAALAAALWRLDFVNGAVWQTVFCLINVCWSVRLWRERRPIAIPTALEDLYQRVFPSWTSREFLSFWQTGKTGAAMNAPLVRAGETPKRIGLVLSGEASVRKEGCEIARLGRGRFFGEMSFVSQKPASADVIAEGEVRFIEWDQEKLRMMRILQSALFAKLQATMLRDLSAKLRGETRAGAHGR